jgi:hypothetical protein
MEDTSGKEWNEEKPEETSGNNGIITCNLLKFQRYIGDFTPANLVLPPRLLKFWRYIGYNYDTNLCFLIYICSTRNAIM